MTIRIVTSWSTFYFVGLKAFRRNLYLRWHKANNRQSHSALFFLGSLGVTQFFLLISQLCVPCSLPFIYCNLKIYAPFLLIFSLREILETWPSSSLAPANTFSIAASLSLEISTEFAPLFLYLNFHFQVCLHKDQIYIFKFYAWNRILHYCSPKVVLLIDSVGVMYEGKVSDKLLRIKREVIYVLKLKALLLFFQWPIANDGWIGYADYNRVRSNELFCLEIVGQQLQRMMLAYSTMRVVDRRAENILCYRFCPFQMHKRGWQFFNAVGISITYDLFLSVFPLGRPIC